MQVIFATGAQQPSPTTSFSFACLLPRPRASSTVMSTVLWSGDLFSCPSTWPCPPKARIQWEVPRSVSVQLFTPWTVARQSPLSKGFSRQEYWSGLPNPSPGDLSDPGIKPKSPAWQADSLPSEPPGKPQSWEEDVLKPENDGPEGYDHHRNSDSAKQTCFWTSNEQRLDL